MWQAPVETVEFLLSKNPQGAAVRNQYGSLPLHMAASNQASQDVIRLLVDSYPDALHLQNDDGMTPLDLAMADESSNPAVIAILEGRAPPAELTRRQKAEQYEQRAVALERKLASLRDTKGRGDKDHKHALVVVRRLADRIPHVLYAAGIDPNQLEIALANSTPLPHQQDEDARQEAILMDAVRRRALTVRRDSRGNPLGSLSGGNVPRDRVEDLLSTIVGLEHVKAQVRGLRRTAELMDLRESLLPQRRSSSLQSLLPVSLQEDSGRPRPAPMVFCGNPGTGKTAVARLLAKVFHELGVLDKPKFLEVERMDLVGRTPEQTSLKTKEVLEEARGGVLFIDEAYTLGMASKRNRGDAGATAMQEMVKAMKNPMDDSFPLIILAGFSLEMAAFLAFQPDLRKSFPILYEFPDYTCDQLAQIFMDLATAKGFDLEEALTTSFLGGLLEQETTVSWRSERNGRVCEMLLTGVRTQVRKRMRRAQMEETDEDFDPHLIMKVDVENVMQSDFK